MNLIVVRPSLLSPYALTPTFDSVIYWMSGLSVNAADFFYFLAITLSVDTALAAFFRFCVFLSPSLILAEVSYQSTCTRLMFAPGFFNPHMLSSHTTTATSYQGVHTLCLDSWEVAATLSWMSRQ
jgi:hypothetical protein